MDQHKVLGLAAITSFGLALADSNATAQQKSLKDQLVGAWMIVRCEVVQPDGTKAPLVFGSNPLGQFIFTDNGRFAFQIAAEVPKFASGDDKKTTPEENKAVVEGSIAYFGAYTVTDADKAIALHIERSSFPNLNGTDGRRIVTAISADEMNWTNPGRFGGGVINCANKRAK
jgi:Lipocalin-like domain